MVSSETELPYNYYSLPFCKPNEGVRKSINSVNPGTILMGSRIENSPYNFSMLVKSSFAKPMACLSACLPPARLECSCLGQRHLAHPAELRACMGPCLDEGFIS